MKAKQVVYIYIIGLIVIMMAALPLHASAAPESRAMVKLENVSSASADGNYYYAVTIEAPQKIMEGSPILVSVSISCNLDENDARQVSMAIKTGSGIHSAYSMPLTCSAGTYSDANNGMLIQDYNQVQFTGGSYQSGLYSKINGVLLLDIASKNDAWIEIVYSAKDGQVVFDKKYDFSDKLVEGADSYTYTKGGSFSLEAITRINAGNPAPGQPPLTQAQKAEGIRKYESGEINTGFTIQSTGAVTADVSGTVPGSKQETDISSYPPGSDTLGVYKIPISLEIGSGSGRVTMTSTVSGGAQTTSDRSGLVIGGIWYHNEYSMSYTHIYVTLADTVDAAAIPTQSAAGAAGLPAVADAPAVMGKPIGPTARSPVQAAAVAAAAVVILGGGAGFFAVNAADYKEVIKLAALAAVPGDAAASGKPAAERLKYPFIYLRLRKYSFLLGIKDEDSSEKLLKKVKLPFKSGGKVVMDLGGAMNSGTYKDLKIRHPKKAMNRRKDVTIAYTENNAILEQDHFDSKEDFTNIKYIEK